MTIYIGLGANLDSVAGSPAKTLAAALALLPGYGIGVRLCSSFYRSPAFPPSDQPDFINAVARIETVRTPENLMMALLDLEQAFGRIRRTKWEPRSLDLDLLDYQGRVRAPHGGPGDLILPHPRLAERAFVLKPLAEIAPGWRHPVSGMAVRDLLAARADASQVVRLDR